MVYEDAMAILGYASPYEVEVEVEDSSMSPISLKNSSMNNHIAHSFFRSQSFSTAQQVYKIILAIFILFRYTQYNFLFATISIH